MIFWFYRLVITPLATLFLPALALFNKKVRLGLRLRMRPLTKPPLTQRPLWIHAASGEFEYAKPVIRELKSRFPDLPIAVTYFSPTYAKSVQSFAGVDWAIPLPLDLPGPCFSFLKRVQPRALLIARTDFWPEILTQARRRRIPIHVFSYTQRAAKWPFLTRWRLNLTDGIACVSPSDQSEVLKIKVTAPTQVLGDTRYDQVHFRLSNPKPLPEIIKPNLPCLVAGSTWSEDETALLFAARQLLLDKRLQLILVPHEPSPEHLEALKRKLEEAKLTHTLFSQQESWSDKHVLLVDQVGFLAELYALGKFAFVGGSFKNTVHSVMEALGAGCLTFVGPKHTNNREAIEFSQMELSNQQALWTVDSPEAFQSRLHKALLLSPVELEEFKKALLKAFNERRGATERLINNLQPLFESI